MLHDLPLSEPVRRQVERGQLQQRPVADEESDADEESSGGSLFDPGEHTVEQVVAYLADADDEERERVLAAERDDKARVGILGT